MEKKKNHLLLVLKGCAMGAADVIPGVSGGTIAFITGIYEELIESIRAINLKALRLLGAFQLKEFWKHINGNFLISVVAGIAISIFSLAKLMKFLLETHPLYIWSFFFGLIIISALMVSREIKKWDLLTITSLIIGAIIAYTITVLTPNQHARCLVVYPSFRSDRHLRHDPTGNIRSLHIITSRKIRIHHHRR